MKWLIIELDKQTKQVSDINNAKKYHYHICTISPKQKVFTDKLNLIVHTQHMKYIYTYNFTHAAQNKILHIVSRHDK